MNSPRPLRTSAVFLDRLAERADDAKPHVNATHSRRSSQSLSSEHAYSPVTPTFSLGGHTRMSSSTSSSLSSSPPNFDHLDPSNASKKPTAPGLPDVVEDPLERDFQADNVYYQDSSDAEDRWSYDMPDMRPSLAFPYNPPTQYQDGFYSDSEIAFEARTKRRRSGESIFNNFTNRVSTRFPSFSRRHRQRTSLPLSENNSPISSPTLSRSASASHSRSTYRRSGSHEVGADLSDAPQPSTIIDTIAEDEVIPQVAPSGADHLEPDAEPSGDAGLTRVSTPLLPHMIEESYPECPVAPEDSLQEPGPAMTTSIYRGFASAANSPPSSPAFVGVQSPPLSSRTSMNTMRPAQGAPWTTTTTTQSAEGPAPAVNESRDEWTDKLGHADFEIHPKPYIPEVCGVESCNQLMLDWERARAEYSRHLGRTNTHFGNTSRIYHLTEEKWAWIDSIWKESFERAKVRARESGDPMPPDSPREPNPVSKMPAIGEKFPQIGDGDIVGPMEQVASQVKRRPSKKAQFMNMIGHLRGRSLSGPR